MNKDQFSNSKPVLALAETAIVAAGTTLGEVIDTLTYRSLIIPINIDWTAGTLDSIGFQESDVSGSGYTDCDDSLNLYYPDAFPAGADALVHVGCISKKRYVKLKIVASGGTCTITLSEASGFLMDGDAPQVQESSVIADADAVGDNPPLRS
jgi:hypothetical protein